MHPCYLQRDQSSFPLRTETDTVRPVYQDSARSLVVSQEGMPERLAETDWLLNHQTELPRWWLA